MPTTNPVPSQDPSDLLFNAGKLDEVLNGTGNSFTDRLGTARRTVAGMNSDFDVQLADAESDLNVYRADAAASAAQALGYLNTIRTTSYGAYASDPATDPLGNPPNVGDEYFNTTSNLLKRFNGTTWQASDINTANLAAPSGSSLVGYDTGTVQDVLDAVTGSSGAASVGYTPAGTGAVATTVEGKLRENKSSNDFVGATVVEKSAAAWSDIQSRSGGSFKISNNSGYLLPSVAPLLFSGGAGRGTSVDFGFNQVSQQNAGGAAVRVENVTGSTAPTLRNELHINGLNLVGPGKSTATTGYKQYNAADVRVNGASITDFSTGFEGEGALSSDYHGIRINKCGLALKLGNSASINPNMMSFYGSRFSQENDKAILSTANQNGVINFFSSNVEGNNLTGTASDGVSVAEHQNAGFVNYIGSHFEGNKGQYSINYQGATNAKILTIFGSEIIDYTDTQLSVAGGGLTAISSRITQAGATNDISLATGSHATLINTEARVSGDLSRLLSIAFGKIAFGARAIFGGNALTFCPAAVAASPNFAPILLQNDSSAIEWQNSASTRMGRVSVSDTGAMAFTRDGTTQGFQFYANAQTKLHISRAGALSIEPGQDNLLTCGSAPLRWSVIHAGTGTISTSDERAKQDIADLDDAEMRVALSLKKLVKKYRFKDAVQVKGDGARIHIGVIAQDVMAAFEAEGLDPMRYAIICYDEWAAELDEDGNEARPAGNRYGVRYDELLAFIIAAL